MRIIWLSRHLPTPRQREALGRLFPNNELIIDTDPFRTADDIITRFHTMHGDELVVVAPLTLLRALTQRGFRPIWAEMEHVRFPTIVDKRPVDESIEVNVNGRWYRFVKFWRVRDVKLELEEIGPTILYLAEGDDEFHTKQEKPDGQ